MQRLIRVFWVLLVLGVASSWSQLWAATTLAVSTIIDDLPRRSQEALELLSGIAPRKDAAEGASQIKDGQYVLWGELFEKGRTQAVVEVSRNPHINTHIALADWDAKDAAWKVRQVIRVPLFWKSPDIQKSEGDELMDNLPEKPFWVKQLAPSIPPMLIISTFHTQHRGGHFVLTYNASVHELNADAADFSVAEPELRSGYVVLTNDSARKAHWGEETFHQVEKGLLHFRGSLRSGSDHGDDIHIHVRFLNRSPADEANWILAWRLNATANDPSYFKIQAGSEYNEGDPVIGHVRFLKPEASASQGAYLLHKLTGLPATLVKPKLFGGEAPVSTLTDHDVQVTGNAEVLRRLGPEKTAAKPEEKGK